MRNQFFTVQQLRSGTGAGLFQYLTSAKAYMGVDDWKSKVIGLDCDGTNANIAACVDACKRRFHGPLYSGALYIACSVC